MDTITQLRLDVQIYINDQILSNLTHISDRYDSHKLLIHGLSDVNLRELTDFMIVALIGRSAYRDLLSQSYGIGATPWA
jgi:hypothetical protein